ncbi:MAG: hypothetical protein ABW352_20215 [Polyangiales bacterium]
MRIVAGLGLGVLLAHCASSEPSKVSPARTEQALENVRRDLSRAPAGLRERRLRDGTQVVQVESGFRHATIVTRAADGTRKARCVNEASEAEAMLRGERE